MPARKSKDLIVRHETKADRTQRADREAALTPDEPLMLRAPKELTGAVGRDVWKKTIGLYLELDTRIVNVLDKGLLIDYCNTCEQLTQIDELRSTAFGNYQKAQKTLDKFLQDDAKKEERT